MLRQTRLLRLAEQHSMCAEQEEFLFLLRRYYQQDGSHEMSEEIPSRHNLPLCRTIPRRLEFRQLFPVYYNERAGHPRDARVRSGPRH